MSLRQFLRLTLAVLVGTLFWSFASPAGAVENPDYTAVAPTTVVATPQPARKVATAVKVAPVRTRLAITGSDATGTVVFGASLLGAGVGIMALRRRASATAAGQLAGR